MSSIVKYRPSQFEKNNNFEHKIVEVLTCICRGSTCLLREVAGTSASIRTLDGVALTGFEAEAEAEQSILFWKSSSSRDTPPSLKMLTCGSLLMISLTVIVRGTNEGRHILSQT